MVSDVCSLSSDLTLRRRYSPLHKPSTTNCIEAAFDVTLQMSSSAHNGFFLSEAWDVKHLRFQRHKITKVSCQGMLHPWGFEQASVCVSNSLTRVWHLECHCHWFPTGVLLSFGPLFFPWELFCSIFSIPWPCPLMLIVLAFLVTVKK